MTLEQKAIESALNRLNCPDNLTYYLFETIPSTNQSLWELMNEGKHPPLVAIAVQQTAGRGQWGRTWESEPGGLYLSLGLCTDILAENAGHLTLFSGWGIAQSLRQADIPVFLKWPNDLILNQQKLGGIKSETKIKGENIAQAVIGVGINWKNGVPSTGINLETWVKEHPNLSLMTLEELAALTLSGILRGYTQYLKNGIEPILKDYLTLLESLGKTVIVNGNLGQVIGVNSQGELKIRLDSVTGPVEISRPVGTINLGYD